MTRSLPLLLMLWTSIHLVSASVVRAQDNPIPQNYPHLTVNVVGTYGNNSTRPLNGATVIVEPQNAANDPHFGDRYPMEQDVNAGVARFRIAPSSLVGPYTITVKSQTCGEETISNWPFDDKPGPKQLSFSLACNASYGGPSPRNSGGRYAMTINVEADEAFGPLKVVLRAPTGRAIQRTAVLRGRAFLRNLSAGSTYRIEIQVLGRSVHSDYPPLKTVEHEMPGENTEVAAVVERCPRT